MRMIKKQAVNPYLPSYEYIPDGEPHVFGDRVYIFGSHDRFNGADFCLNDYVCYSAPVINLSDWRYEGVIYRKEQDPDNGKQTENIYSPVRGAAAPEEIHEHELNEPGIRSMYAPDVVRGFDGRFYLYYCLADRPEIRVAVCNDPAGSYHFLGYVRHREGDPLGSRKTDLIQFDPGLFIDEDGEIYLYSGNTSLEKNWNTEKQASQVMTLEKDMLTIKAGPALLLPGRECSIGTGFEGHEFFEASSLRKRSGLYYFVYSSINLHELCYAISQYPDREFRYGGTIVDIADIGYQGRIEQDGVNCLGNTHGGIECINGRWYVFYHRQTNRTQYSRQGCAEEIFFNKNGEIDQVEVTSQGLNGGPLHGEGEYPAYICCHLRASTGAVFSLPSVMGKEYPYLTQDEEDLEPGDLDHIKRGSHQGILIEEDLLSSTQAPDTQIEPVQYIAAITSGSSVGYKYFDIKGPMQITLTVRGEAEGIIQIRDGTEGNVLGMIPLRSTGSEWINVTGTANYKKGIYALYFCFTGIGKFDLRAFRLHALL